jgi:hypothetical protein
MGGIKMNVIENLNSVVAVKPVLQVEVGTDKQPQGKSFEYYLREAKNNSQKKKVVQEDRKICPSIEQQSFLMSQLASSLMKREEK